MCSQRVAFDPSMTSTMRSGIATFCVSPSSAASSKHEITCCHVDLSRHPLRQMGEQFVHIGERSEVHDLWNGERLRQPP